MAKLKPILGELSGKIAANVFSHNAYGPYVRAKTTPTNPNSTRQQLVRSRLAYLASSWATLTDAQRSLWANYGASNPVPDAFGQLNALTAQAAFVQLNARTLNLSGSIALSPPATQNGATPFSGTATVSSPSTITLAGAATLVATYRYEVLATPGAAAGRNPNIRAAKWAAASATAAGGTIPLTSAVAFVAGQYTNLFVRVTDIYGQSNTPVKLRVQCA
jgi:hypothetical protein